MSQKTLKLISIAAAVALLAACSEQDSAGTPESTKAMSESAPANRSSKTRNRRKPGNGYGSSGQFLYTGGCCKKH